MGVSVGVASAGLEPLDDHIDITATYHLAEEAWEWSLVIGPDGFDPATSYFPGRDLDFASGEGVRLADRPAGSQWDFIGVEAGEPAWIFPAAVPGERAWVGFGDVPSGKFSERLRVNLAGVEGPEGGVFAMFDGFNPPAVFFKTVDGISGEDVWVRPDFHAHVDWSFSKKGMWRVELQVSGFLGPDGTDPTPVSEPVPLHFAIGEFARWRAGRFGADEVMDETVAGPAADPDGDGLSNLLEYALGGDPRMSADVHPQSGESIRVAPGTVSVGGASHVTLEFHRRTRGLDAGTTAEVSYAVEWSDSLDAEDWTPGGETVSVTDLGGGWETVVIRDPRPVGPGRRFGRLRVTGL
jgi:surface-anchored protein